MGTESSQLRVLFSPFMASGHLIPMIDMAKLFAVRGRKSTIVALTWDEATVSKSVAKTKSLGFDIDVVTVKLPREKVGFPEEYDGLHKIDTIQKHTQFVKAVRLLDRQLQHLIEKLRKETE